MPASPQKPTRKNRPAQGKAPGNKQTARYVFGDGVRLRVLEAQAAAAGAVLDRVAQRWHVQQANLWRDSYNPLRGLTIAKAVALLEDGDRGAYADLQWTYNQIEQNDAVLGALIDARTSALEEMDWGIKISERANTAELQKLAKLQRDKLHMIYDGIGNLQSAFEFLALASFRGYSHLEIVQDEAGKITELAPVEQWYWCRAGRNGDWKYNAQSASGAMSGADIPTERFIVREVPRPINRVALIAHIRKGMSQKDWDAFVETYGIPPVFITMPPELGEPQRAAFQSIAEQVIGDSRGVLPGNSDVKTVDAGGRGNNPFREHLTYQDEQIVLRGTGGKLTMLSAAGSGTLAGGAHMETFNRLAAAEAKKISEILNTQLDAKIMEIYFPGQPVLAYFRIAENEETDVGEIVKDVETLNRAGYAVDQAWLEEKSGYKLAQKSNGQIGRLIEDEEARSQNGILNREKSNGKSCRLIGDEKSNCQIGSLIGDEIINRQFGGLTIQNREEGSHDDDEPGLLATAAQLLAAAQVADMTPEADRLREILATESDDRIAGALMQWSLDLPKSVKRTSEMEQAMESVLAAAFGTGFEGK